MLLNDYSNDLFQEQECNKKVVVYCDLIGQALVWQMAPLANVVFEKKL